MTTEMFQLLCTCNPVPIHSDLTEFNLSPSLNTHIINTTEICLECTRQLGITILIESQIVKASSVPGILIYKVNSFCHTFAYECYLYLPYI